MNVAAPGGGSPGAVDRAAERNPARAAAYVVSVVGALSGPVCYLAFPGVEAWRLGGPGDVLALVPAMLVLASPFAAFLLAARLSRTRTGAAVVAALALVAVLFGALLYVDAVVRRDFLVLLATVGVPAVQWLMALPALVAAVVLRNRRPPAGSR